jgi:hypothetical protein
MELSRHQNLRTIHHTQVDLHASLASRWSGKVEALKKADEERREALEVTQT